jgi:hypothetical protein
VCLRGVFGQVLAGGGVSADVTKTCTKTL